MNDLDLRIALHRDADLVGEPSPDLLDQLAVRRDKQRRQRAGMLAAALGVVVIAAGIPVGSSLLTQSDPGPAVEITTPAPSTTQEVPTAPPAPSPTDESSGAVVDSPPVPEGAAPSVTQQARVVSPDETYFFETPSGNINCSISRVSAVCEVRKQTYEPPAKPSDCDLDYGTMIAVKRGERAEFSCHGDTGFGAIGTFEMAYGERISNGIVTCSSATSGMSCSTASGSHGFELSRGSYRLY